MLTELISYGSACGAFAWLIDNRIFKGRKKYFEMCNWFDQMQKKIESETNYQRLSDLGPEIAEKFRHYQKYLDYDMIRAHDKALTGLLEERKFIVLNQYAN